MKKYYKRFLSRKKLKQFMCFFIKKNKAPSRPPRENQGLRLGRLAFVDSRAVSVRPGWVSGVAHPSNRVKRLGVIPSYFF